MQHTIVRHNVKRLSFVLEILLLISCHPADAKTIQIRGTPGPVEAGPTMFPDGYNFPELICRTRDNQTYEWLNISFAANGTIDKGDAPCKTDIANVNGTDSNMVILKSVKHYSEIPLILKTGYECGDFELTSITNDTIEMKKSKNISCSLDNSMHYLHRVQYHWSVCLRS